MAKTKVYIAQNKGLFAVFNLATEFIDSSYKTEEEALQYVKESSKTLTLVPTEQVIKAKRAAIKKLTQEVLKDCFDAAQKKIEKALNSGAVEPLNWSEKYSKMVLPKCIVAAILIDEADQINGSGSGYEKEMKKNIKNIGLYI